MIRGHDIEQSEDRVQLARLTCLGRFLLAGYSVNLPA